jgi:formate-nitrite transporter family protein
VNERSELLPLTYLGRQPGDALGEAPLKELRPVDEELKVEEEQEEIYRRTAPTGQVVYQAIYEEADHELGRDTAGLAWSGVAAGLSMGFSMIVQAMLMVYVPAVPWRPLLAKLGYTVGFLMVILGRQQLFTENTLTRLLRFGL